MARGFSQHQVGAHLTSARSLAQDILGYRLNFDPPAWQRLSNLTYIPRTGPSGNRTLLGPWALSGPSLDIGLPSQQVPCLNGGNHTSTRPLFGSFVVESIFNGQPGQSLVARTGILINRVTSFGMGRRL